MCLVIHYITPDIDLKQNLEIRVFVMGDREVNRDVKVKNVP